MKISKVLLVVSVVSFVITSIVHATPLTDGMVAYWNFEGNAIDQSGNGHDGTLTGEATYFTTTGDYAFLGQSIYLGDGGWRSSASVVVPDHDDLDFTTNFTIMMWIKPTASSLSRVIVKSNWTSDSADGYVLWCGVPSWGRTGDVQINMKIDEETSNIAKSTIGIQTNEWQHVTASYDLANEAVRFYLNGVFVDQQYIDGPANDSSDDLTIGGLSFGGYIDELILYNTTLSDQQILYNYTSGPGIPDTDPGDTEPDDTDPVPPAVPEPVSIVLLGMGIVGWVIRKR